MKKLLIFFMMILFLAGGCKKRKYEQLVCEYNSDKVMNKVIFYFENNESTNYDKEVTNVFESENDANKYYDEVSSENVSNVEIVDSRVNMHVTESLDGMMMNEVKSMYEKYGYVCK